MKCMSTEISEFVLFLSSNVRLQPFAKSNNDLIAANCTFSEGPDQTIEGVDRPVAGASKRWEINDRLLDH